MEKKLIDLYKEWMETGEINDRSDSMGCGGLCNAVPIQYKQSVKLFVPDDFKTYWGSPTYKFGGQVSNKHLYEFNSLRQFIVLFVCAIHNEL